LKEALARGPTEGPWKWVQHYSISQPKRVEFEELVDEKETSVVLSDGSSCGEYGAYISSEEPNGVFIAACSPDRIARLIAHTKAMENAALIECERANTYQLENARLRAQVTDYEKALTLVIESIDAAEVEGLVHYIQEGNERNLSDLLTRRILHHVPEARAALAKYRGNE